MHGTAAMTVTEAFEPSIRTSRYTQLETNTRCNSYEAFSHGPDRNAGNSGIASTACSFHDVTRYSEVRRPAATKFMRSGRVAVTENTLVSSRLIGDWLKLEVQCIRISIKSMYFVLAWHDMKATKAYFTELN